VRWAASWRQQHRCFVQRLLIAVDAQLMAASEACSFAAHISRALPLHLPPAAHDHLIGQWLLVQQSCNWP
jgi:hypothetical protein